MQPSSFEMDGRLNWLVQRRLESIGCTLEVEGLPAECSAAQSRTRSFMLAERASCLSQPDWSPDIRDLFLNPQKVHPRLHSCRHHSVCRQTWTSLFTAIVQARCD